MFFMGRARLSFGIIRSQFYLVIAGSITSADLYRSCSLLFFFSGTIRRNSGGNLETTSFQPSGEELTKSSFEHSGG